MKSSGAPRFALELQCGIKEARAIIDGIHVSEERIAGRREDEAVIEIHLHEGRNVESLRHGVAKRIVGRNRVPRRQPIILTLPERAIHFGENHFDGLEKTGQSAIEFLSRHVTGDWGELPVEDRAENYLSLRRGFRLLSSYRTSAGDTLWVITEADRASTTVLLPEEY